MLPSSVHGAPHVMLAPTMLGPRLHSAQADAVVSLAGRGGEGGARPSPRSCLATPSLVSLSLTVSQSLSLSPAPIPSHPRQTQHLAGPCAVEILWVCEERAARRAPGLSRVAHALEVASAFRGVNMGKDGPIHHGRPAEDRGPIPSCPRPTPPNNKNNI